VRSVSQAFTPGLCVLYSFFVSRLLPSGFSVGAFAAAPAASASGASSGGASSSGEGESGGESGGGSGGSGGPTERAAAAYHTAAVEVRSQATAFLFSFACFAHASHMLRTCFGLELTNLFFFFLLVHALLGWRCFGAYFACALSSWCASTLQTRSRPSSGPPFTSCVRTPRPPLPPPPPPRPPRAPPLRGKQRATSDRVTATAVEAVRAALGAGRRQPRV